MIAGALIVASTGCAPLLPAPELPDGVAVETVRVEGTVADRYRPAFGPVVATVLLAHGFTRDRTTLAQLALDLAAAGFVVVVPDLPHLADRQGNAGFLSRLAAAERARGDSKLIFAGFSAGAAATLAAAAEEKGLAGWIGLDPVALDAAPLAARLRAPAFVLRAPPGACNANASFAAVVPAFANLLADRVLPEATHCDFEAPTDTLCRRSCGEASPARQREVRAAVLEAARAMAR